ncbi:MAG: XRE family transcriptional regulator [Candidatus Brocadiales bacterium]|nr:XRE family transcriptional regulator [Candidatus Brocadiales bacterium]
MNTNKRFNSVWDALEENPVRAENLKLRSKLMIAISEHIKQQNLKQKEIAEILHITQPRVSSLLQGKINNFRLDSLIDMAHRLGLRISMEIAA